MKIKIITLLLFACSTFAQDKTQAQVVSLPDAPNSWIINIHQRGGIIGVHKLLVSINSEGKYTCSENGKVKTLEPTNKNFLELTELINPIQNDVFLKTINEAFEYCNDCLYSTLSFRRHREEVPDGEIVEAASKQTVEPSAKKISEKVWKTVNCN